MGNMPGDCWIGLYSVVRTTFFLTILFQRECGKVLLSVAIMGHIFSSMVQSEEENDMEPSF
jgi:hypothetical protein